MANVAKNTTKNFSTSSSNKSTANSIASTFSSTLPHKKTKEEIAAEKQQTTHLQPNRSDSGEWMLGDFYAGKDKNNNFSVDDGEIDDDALRAIVDYHREEEDQIIATGQSDRRPNTWEEALHGRYITKDQYDEGIRSGQTYKDGRFGPNYKVKHEYDDGAYEHLTGQADNLFQQDLDSGYSMPSAQQVTLAGDAHRRGLKEWNAGLRDDLEGYAGEDYDPFLLMNGSLYDRNSYVADQNAKRQTGYELGLLTDKYAPEGRGIAMPDGFEGTYVLDMYDQTVQDGRWNTTEGENAWMSRLKDGNHSLEGAAADTSSNYLTDMYSVVPAALNYEAAVVRNLDDFLPFLPERWNGHKRSDVENDLRSYYSNNSYGATKEAAVSAVMSNDPSLSSDEVHTTPIVQIDCYDEKGDLFVIDSSNAGSSEAADALSNSARQELVYGDPSDERNAVTWLAFGASDLKTDPRLILDLTNGESVDEFQEAGFGGRHPDIIGENGIEYSQIPNHPEQAVAFLANTLVGSLPYMMPGGVLNIGGDVTSSVRGVSPFEAEPGSFGQTVYEDPGYMWADELVGRTVSTAGEGLTEKLFGLAGGSLLGGARNAYRRARKIPEQTPGQATDKSLGEFAFRVADTALGEGVEELPAGYLNEFEKGDILADPGEESILGLDPELGNVGRSYKRDELGNVVFDAFGDPVYDETETEEQRNKNLRKTLFDNFVVGATLGGLLGIPANTKYIPTKDDKKKSQVPIMPDKLKSDEEYLKMLEDMGF